MVVDMANSPGSAARQLLGTLGCEAGDLSLSDEIRFERSAKDVRGRTIALFGMVAVSYGLDPEVALQWLVACERQCRRSDRHRA